MSSSQLPDLLTAMLDQLPEPLILCGSGDRVLFANRACLRQFPDLTTTGLTERLRFSPATAMPPQDFDQQLAFLDGLPCALSASSHVQANGDPLRLLRLTPLFDHSPPDNCQAWLESMPLPLALRSLDGHFIWANAIFCQMVGRDRDQLIGQPLDAVLCAEDAARLRSADEDILTHHRACVFELQGHTRHCQDGPHIAIQAPCRITPHVTGIMTALEARHLVRVDTPDTREVELRYQRLARHLLTLKDQRHAALARELHDGLGQSLIAIKLSIHAALRRISHPLEMQDTLASTLDMVDITLQTVRQISRGLHPPHLLEFGLLRSLSGYLDGIRRHSPIEFDIRLARELPSLRQEIQHACLRIAQEAVTNSLRHAEARRISVILLEHQGELVLSVCDNGRGFHPHDHAGQHPGLGLLSMSERAYLSGGALVIDSRPGDGTTITASWPLLREET